MTHMLSRVEQQLPPLQTARCRALPGRLIPTAYLIRRQALQRLWPLMTTAAEQQALLAVMRSYDDAHWWITHHQQQLTALLGKQMRAWLALKARYQAADEAGES